MPTCVVCKGEFDKLPSKSRCRACYNSYMSGYMLARYHRRRREAIAAMGGRCAKCGSTEEIEFDHVERALKRGEIAKLLSQAESRYLKELEKCQLLCRPCHTEKTRSEITVGHGGGLSGVSGCKCDLCKAKRSEYMREWKRKKKEKGKGP